MTPAASVPNAPAAEKLTQAPGLPAPPPRIADVVSEPEVSRRVTPAYPPAALAAELQGTVVLSGVIGTDGKVRDIKVVQSVHPLLDRAASKALAEYEFKPARRNGIPIPWPYRLKMPFALK